MKRIEDKIQDISTYLSELEDILPGSFKKYKTNKEKKAACERYVEKIVEATVDLAFVTIKLKRFRIPDDDADAFAVLKENGIIGKQLCDLLKSAKGMRNVLAHQYAEVDDRIVFDSITGQLGRDVRKFMNAVQSAFKSSRK